MCVTSKATLISLFGIRGNKVGSPGRLIERTFTFVAVLPAVSRHRKRQGRKYRNPIHLARQYKQLLDNGTCKSVTTLAKHLEKSRIRVNQMVTLLRLDARVIAEIEALGDPLPRKIVTEHMLRPHVGKPYEEQIKVLEKIR